MIYRTAHRATYRNINDNLGLVSYRIAQLTNRVASEKRINTPSDDPTGAARVLGTRSTLSAITQYRTNVAVSDLWLAESGNAAQTIKEALDKVYTLAEQGATDTYNDSQREAMLTEVEGWFQQIIQNGNTKIGDSYIFSGQKVSTQSFAAQVEAQKARAGCQNSTAWTGQVQNYGSQVFNNRPDLPVQSQDFLIEVVQPGGVDSRWFATPSKPAGASIGGRYVTSAVPMGTLPYTLSLTATDPRYNNAQVRFVAGEVNRTTTGSVAGNTGLSFPASALASVMGYGGPITVSYVLGESYASARATAGAAAWDAALAGGLSSAAASSAAAAAAAAVPPAAAAYDGAGGFTVTLLTAGLQPPASLAPAQAAASALTALASAEGWLAPARAAAGAAAWDTVLASTLTISLPDPVIRAAASAACSAALADARLAGLNSAAVAAAGAAAWDAAWALGRAPGFPASADTAAAAQAWDTAWATALSAGQSYSSAAAAATLAWESALTPPGPPALSRAAAAVIAAKAAFAALPATAAAAKAAASENIFGLTDAPPNTGLGLVRPETITFNATDIAVEVQGDLVTVYLPRANSPDGQGEFLATTLDVANALADLARDPGTGAAMFSAAATAGSNLIFQPSPTWTPLATSRPYTLAHAALNPRGTQNDLVWAVKNNGNPYVGAAGNQLSVQYVIPTDPMTISPNPRLDFNEASGLVTVYVAADINVYNSTYAQVFYETGNNLTAHEKAIAAAVTTTANDVVNLVKNDPVAGRVFDVTQADGNSGDGRINYELPRTWLDDGYDQPALFRVSQDGGKTWGPPQTFGAGEYQTGDMFHNAFLGHASLTTDLPGQSNDLVFTARYQGTWGNDLRVEYQLPDPADHPNPATTVTVGPNPWNVCVTLRTDAQGRVLSTAKEVMEAVNSHPVAGQLVWADLANYHEGGDGVVNLMKCSSLSVGEPYQVNGQSVITPLGYATAKVGFNYSAPDQSDPNLIFQATTQGPAGNSVGVRYTTSADPTFHASLSAANAGYQKDTTVRYETDPITGRTVLVVHLGTEELPSCPDEATDPAAAAGWRKAFPLYACTSNRAVTTTAGDVLKAVIDYNTAHPEQAAVWPQFERYPEGWDSTAKVGPTDGTVWLTGGNETESAGRHGVNLKFIPDGSSLQTGDIFEVPVGWYRGDEKNMDVNIDSGARGTLNTAGSELLGSTGAGDNILDTIQRLIFALKKNDTEAIGRELPEIRAAIEKVTTLESKIGTKQIRNQFVNNTLDQKQYSSESLLSAIEDVDFSRLITDLKNAQTVYEALLGVTGMTTRISLLSYLT